jgi:hypothetical protein
MVRSPGSGLPVLIFLHGAPLAALLSSTLLAACGDEGGDGGGSAGTVTATTGGSGGSGGGSTTAGGSGSTGTATSTSTTGTTSGGSGSSGPGFIMMPDGAGASECDVWSQDCPAGEKCMPWANDGGNAWNATKCSPLDPQPKQPGDPCAVEGSGVSGVDDCDKGVICYDVDFMTGMGTCVGLCHGSETDPMCDDPATVCGIYNDGVLPLCLTKCDPLAQDCPNDANVCVQLPDASAFVCWLDASGMEGQHGDPCEYVNVCDAGLFCANADAVPDCMGSIGCCSTFCDVSDPNASANCPGAAGGEMCVSYFDMGMAPPGYENVGGCIIPP